MLIVIVLNLRQQFYNIKRNSPYIVFLILLSFLLSIVPFHAFHKHIESEHFVALQTKNIEHSCELDEIICQGEFKTDLCHHKTHLGKPIEKCFSCEFHFTKNYILKEAFSFVSLHSLNQSLFFSNSQKELIFNKFISNKGPPTIA